MFNHILLDVYEEKVNCSSPRLSTICLIDQNTAPFKQLTDSKGKAPASSYALRLSKLIGTTGKEMRLKIADASSITAISTRLEKVTSDKILGVPRQWSG